MSTAAPSAASSARFALETAIQAPRESVWELITAHPDEWWVDDMRVVPSPSTMTFEARAGGTLVESNADGHSLLWFTVLSVEPGRSLNLAGCLAPPWGGPAQTYLHIELEDADDGCLVRMTNSMHGHIGDSTIAQMTEGWRLLLESGIKRAAEAR